MNFAALKEARKKSGLTQQDMAEALGYSGKSGYSCLESGKVKISVDVSLKIKEVLNLTESEYKDIFLQ